MDTVRLARPGYQTVAIAAVEAVEQLRQLFPGAVVTSSEPFEDEDVCLIVYGLWEDAELQRLRNQVYELEFALYERYDVEVMIKVLPRSYLAKPEAGHR